jgi:hypothetical protein
MNAAQYPADVVRLSCPKCGRAGQYRKQNLIERYGADLNSEAKAAAASASAKHQRM